MVNSVDLTDLRSMTDGDIELELALFQEFYSSSEELIDKLATHCADGPSETWRATAHALKGTGYNIGAHPLGDLCKQAQDNPAADQADKQALLEKIKSEYVVVKAYLQTVHTR
jgi:HPt (histidine-containing phosphotransfer) domain-containing protein